MEIILSTLVANAITFFTKGKIKEKFGSFGVQVFVFVVAVIFAVVTSLLNGTEMTVAAVLSEAATILALAIATYEILWKKVGQVMRM